VATFPRIIPCLWFNTEAEDAANFYVSVFKNAKITNVSRAGDRVITAAFELEGISFTALNGGPEFSFTEAVSLQIMCETQDEIDYYWDRLTDGGQEGRCGWLKDKFGLSWQVVPTVLPKLLGTPGAAARVTQAFMQMKKFNIAELQRAADAS
jgi:predicted 3-demethylubiquinone-9 3-methyltransferase (glyoxalase superfamily)